MKTLIAIPARYASTRYPGKPLVTLKGPDGEKTLIRRSWEAATAVQGIDRVVVATKIFPLLPVAPVVRQRAHASAGRLGEWRCGCRGADRRRPEHLTRG